MGGDDRPDILCDLLAPPSREANRAGCSAISEAISLPNCGSRAPGPVHRHPLPLHGSGREAADEPPLDQEEKDHYGKGHYGASRP